jgi:hypothetical protein
MRSSILRDWSSRSRGVPRPFDATISVSSTVLVSDALGGAAGGAVGIAAAEAVAALCGGGSRSFGSERAKSAGELMEQSLSSAIAKPRACSRTLAPSTSVAESGRTRRRWSPWPSLPFGDRSSSAIFCSAGRADSGRGRVCRDAGARLMSDGRSRECTGAVLSRSSARGS